jgi:hypothetical protein
MTPRRRVACPAWSEFEIAESTEFTFRSRRKEAPGLARRDYDIVSEDFFQKKKKQNKIGETRKH